jgi:hypothetical protein
MTVRSLMIVVHKKERNASEQTRVSRTSTRGGGARFGNGIAISDRSDQALREALGQSDVCHKNIANDRSPRAPQFIRPAA